MIDTRWFIEAERFYTILQQQMVKNGAIAEALTIEWEALSEVVRFGYAVALAEYMDLEVEGE